MQLIIMNKVKSGELSIEDALTQAREDRKQLIKQKSQTEEVFSSVKVPRRKTFYTVISFSGKL